MAIPALPQTSRTTGVEPGDFETAALARPLRRKREDAQALVRLVQQAAPSNDKGQNIDYYA